MNRPAFKSLPTTIRWWMGLSLRALASPKFSFVLLIAWAALLVWATMLEAARGREYCQWYVYDSRWFLMLLGLLGVNCFAATFVRLPWTRRSRKREQIGILTTHVGLLVLLTGAVQTHFGGVQGELVLSEGKDVSAFVVTSHSVIKIVHANGEQKISTELSFAPGPVDWPEETQLDFGQSRGLAVKIVKFYRHAVEYNAWVADEQDYQGPALQLRLEDAQGDVVAEDWLAGSAFGGEAVIGPTGYQFWPLPAATMLDDFRQPPVDDMGTTGVLSMHYGGKTYRTPVDGKVGAEFPIGDTGIEVEIVGYYPDARPSPQGGFYSRSQRTSNPLLELKLHLPDGQSLSQLAFARRPLLTNDGVTGNICPVRFWYHHADVPPTPGADFVQTPDGRLYCRTTIHDRRSEAVEIHVGDRIPLGSQFSLALLQYIPHARQERGFRPIETRGGADSTDEAAALLEVDYDGMCQQVWMKRKDPQFSFASIVTQQGRAMLTFDYQRCPLGYSVKLQDFVRVPLSGSNGNVALTSDVELTDGDGAVIGQYTVAMNQPLTCGKYTFCQSSNHNADQDKATSALTVSCDPGRFLKYAGSWMIGGGMLLMLFQRSGLFRQLPCLAQGLGTDAHNTDSQDGEGPGASSFSVPRPLGLGRHRNLDVDRLIS